MVFCSFTTFKQQFLIQFDEQNTTKPRKNILKRTDELHHGVDSQTAGSGVTGVASWRAMDTEISIRLATDILEEHGDS